MPVILTCTFLVLLPGAILAYSLGFRRISLMGLAPALSLSLVGVAAVGTPFVGVGWNVWAVVVLTAVASAVGWFLTNFRQREVNRALVHRDSWPSLAAMVVGACSGAILVGRRIMQLVGAPDNIAQRYDNVFQLNAIRHILDSENGSTLTLGQMAGGQGIGAVYPAVWHDLAALLVQLTGTSVAMAENAVNLTIGAVIWPISVIFLTRIIAGPKPVVLVASGIISAGLVAFPFLLLVWGPLFPNMLSVSVVPAALAVVILLCKLSEQQERPWRLWIAATIMVPGLAFSHMSAIGAILAFSAPILIWTAGRYAMGLIRSKSRAWKYVLLAGITGAAAVITYFIWIKLRPGDYSGWTPHTDMSGAIGEVLTNAVMGTKVTWMVSFLAVVGVLSIIGKRCQIWWLLSYSVAAALYIADAALDRGFIRTFLTGIWYADTNRVAAYLAIFAVVLAAIGFGRIVEGGLSLTVRLATPKESQHRAGESQSSGLAQKNMIDTHGVGRATVWNVAGSIALVIVLLGSLAVTTQMGNVRHYVGATKQFYERDTSTSILSDDEYKLLSRIDTEVPPGAVVAGNPWNGSTLVYAFADRDVLSYHLSQGKTPMERLVDAKLNVAADDAAVCHAIRELGVTFVLDFGNQYLLNHPESKNYAGLQNLSNSSSVQLVDEEGAAKLYRVTACW